MHSFRHAVELISPQNPAIWIVCICMRPKTAPNTFQRAHKYIKTYFKEHTKQNTNEQTIRKYTAHIYIACSAETTNARTCLDFSGKLIALRRPFFGFPISCGGGGGAQQWEYHKHRVYLELYTPKKTTRDIITFVYQLHTHIWNEAQHSRWCWTPK